MEDNITDLSFSEVEYRLMIANSNIQRLLEIINYNESSPGAPPAAKHIIENLPDVTLEKNDQCTICLKIFSKGDTVKKLPCNHFFDKECIVKWLEKTNTCPLCRNEMETDDVEYEEIRKEKLRAKQREAELEILHNSMYS